MNHTELITNARKRAQIRRSIPRGEPDRIADILEALCDALESAHIKIYHLLDENEGLTVALEETLHTKLPNKETIAAIRSNLTKDIKFEDL